MIDIDITNDTKARIKVVGVGGGGGNAVDRMIEDRIEHIVFISANTDNMALAKSKASIRIQLGEKLTRGLGAGGKPEVGRRAAEETRDTLAKAIEDTELLFITAGMGGGTGTGAAPVIASVAREMGILTVGVVTKPFNFEGAPRMRNALEGIAELKKSVDTLVIIPNERLLAIVNEEVSLIESFRLADDVLRQGVQGISDLILKDGLINLDFADVRTVMHDQGIAHMGVGRGTGKGRVENAAKAAINSPLLETSINGARSVIINFAGDSNLGMKDIEAAAKIIQAAVDPNANTIFGATIDDTLKEEVIATVIATGLGEKPPSVKPTTKTRKGNVPVQEEDDDDDPSEALSAKSREKLKPIRTEIDNDTPFEIPIFLQRKRN